MGNNLVELEHDYEVPDEAVFEHFGIEGDIFDFLIKDTEDIKACKGAIRQAIRRGRMLALVGDVGSGKTTLLDLLEIDREITLIRADYVNQWLITPTSLIEIMIRSLRYDDKYGAIPRSHDRKLNELAKLLHSHKKGGETIVLALDDGQQFRAETLRILKRLREMSYWGKSRLFEILVLTHRSGAQKIQMLEEVGRRFTFRYMRGFTPAELKAYVIRAAGRFFADEAVLDDFCRSVCDRRPLVVQGLILMALTKAMLRGGTVVEAKDIESNIGLLALVKRFNVSYSTIMGRAGVGRTTVSDILRGVYKGRTETASRVLSVAREAIHDEQKKRREEAVSQAAQTRAGGAS